MFFFGCEVFENDENNGPYNLCYEISITSNTPGYYNVGEYESIVDYETIYLTGSVNSGSVSVCNKKISSDFINDCLSYETFFLSFYPEENGCSSIEVDVFFEGEWKQSEQFQLGCISGLYDGGVSGGVPDCEDYCSLLGNSYSINLNPICL